jgi:hypothetical protein
MLTTFDAIHRVRETLDAFGHARWLIAPRPVIDRGRALTVWEVARPGAPGRTAAWVVVGELPPDIVEADDDVRSAHDALRALRHRWREGIRGAQPGFARIFARAVRVLEGVVPEAFTVWR